MSAPTAPPRKESLAPPPKPEKSAKPPSRMQSLQRSAQLAQQAAEHDAHKPKVCDERAGLLGTLTRRHHQTEPEARDSDEHSDGLLSLAQLAPLNENKSHPRESQRDRRRSCRAAPAVGTRGPGSRV